MGNILYLSHGGGPLPLLGDAGHEQMVARLQALAVRLPKPDAILLVSAHWEASPPRLTAAAQPELLYDYYGFPPESYDILYPCPGLPSLAQRAQALLNAAGIEAAQDSQRGFDHGLFVPLKIMYPQADIPCVQLSLDASLDADLQLRMGQALAPLRDEKLLLIGSGFSFHNMHEFFRPASPEAQALNQAFEGWLHETCSAKDSAVAWQRLQHWQEAPGAAFCHPRAEHLLPLMVCYGAANAPCAEALSLEVLGKQCSMFVW